MLHHVRLLTGYPKVFLMESHHRIPSDDISPSSPLDWARNLLKPWRQSGEQIEVQGRSPAQRASV
ncbi:hypothetical protein P692DRAFT_201795521, partial [Suillus brevipes Sb2]